MDSLYKKYIPNSFDDLIGQDLPVLIIKNIIKNITKVKPHGIIFSGPSGVGKSSLSKIFTRQLNIQEEHVIEVDGAQDNGVAFMKSLIDQMKYVPLSGDYKVAIIDEAHMLSRSAFDSLLLYIENPDPHSIFIFTTTRLEKIPETIRSRNIVINMNKIPEKILINRLKEVCLEQNISTDNENLQLLVNYSQGNLRQAYSTLQTLADVPLNQWKNYFKIISQQSLLELFTTILEGKTVQALEIWDNYSQQGYEEQFFYREFSRFLNDVSTALFTDNKYSDLLIDYHLPQELIVGFWEILLTQQEAAINGLVETIPMMIKMMSTLHDQCSLFGYAKKMINELGK